MTNRTALIVLAVLARNVTAQSLDWSGDMILFGTGQDEHHPCLSAIGANVFHAFCIVGEDTLAMKRSENSGEGWSAVSKTHAPVSSPMLVTASDGGFTYLFSCSESPAQKHLFRFASSAGDWSTASELDIAPERTSAVACLSAVSDVVAQPSDPYLNVCWVERDATNHLITVFAQSRDHGASFCPASVINSSSAPAGMAASVSVAVTWIWEEERIHVVVPVDRAGSMPEELRIFTSVDQGASWSQGMVVDSSGYPQKGPSLAGYANTVFLVYPRRVDVTAQHDIFFTYSPDGGESFAPPVAITDSAADEFEPRVVIDPSGQQFYIFYLVATVIEEPATLMVCSGSVATPWQIESPVVVSEPLTAMRSGGISVVATDMGVAAAWSSPFELGDTDIHFDASWRGNSTHEPGATIPSRFTIGCAYPNPFNSTTTVPLLVDREQMIDIILTDMLGRRVGTAFSGTLPAGRHSVELHLAGLPSGLYWLHRAGSAQTAQRLLLLR